MKVFKNKNDITLLYEKNYGVSTTAIAIYVRCGSVFERDENAGISHVIEHMMFKGSDKYNNIKLNELLDLYSVSFNAFTSRDITAYYAITTEKYIKKCAELFSDMFFNAKFPEKEFELEKGVILSELQASKTDDDDIAADNLERIAYGKSRRAIPIIGFEDTIKSLTRNDLIEFKKKMYTSNNTFLSITGHISESKAKSIFDTFFKGKIDVSNVNNYEYVTDLDNYSQDNYVEHINDSEESTTYISYDTYSPKNLKEKTILSLYDLIFSQGMSSRLFTTIREKNGLVYSINSYLSGAKEEQKRYIVFSCDNSNEIKTLKLVNKEVLKLAEKGISKKEFYNAKIRMINLLKSSKDSLIKMSNSFVKELIISNEEVSLDDIILECERLSYEDIGSYKNKIFLANTAKISFVGKKSELFVISDLYNIVR